MLVPEPSDDSFHSPPVDDPYWTETSWFGFSVPERNLAGAVYPVFRTNQGICSCNVSVWDDTADSPWDVPYSRSYWHLGMPDHDLTALSLPNGLTYECLEPLSRYHVRYRDGDEIDLDFVFEGLREAHAIMLSPELGHFDQIGRVTGMLRLHGEEIPLDCMEMRDRTWSVRADHGPVRAGYSYGTASADLGFHTLTMGTGLDPTEMVVGGYLLRDGVQAKLVSGTRHVARENGRPVVVVVVGQDTEGREFRAEGTCVNRYAFQSTPNYFAWMSLARWEIDGAEAFGQDQDVWSPDLVRSAARA